MNFRFLVPAALQVFLGASGFSIPANIVTQVYSLEVVPVRVPAEVKVEPISHMIAKGEGDWNAVNRGRAGDTPGGLQELLGYTCEKLLISDLLRMQASGKIYAVGRYQFIPSTLRYAIEKAGVSEMDFFSPRIQDKLLVALLQHKRPEVWAYLNGEGSLEDALDALAKEWASIATSNGVSYYQGVGNNQAHVTRDEAADALRAARMLF